MLVSHSRKYVQQIYSFTHVLFELCQFCCHSSLLLFPLFFQVLCIWKEVWRRRGSSLVDCFSTARYLTKFTIQLLFCSCPLLLCNFKDGTCVCIGMSCRQAIFPGDITVTFPPIWSLLFLQTHTLHVLAKYHTMHDTEALPVSESEISQCSLYTTICPLCVCRYAQRQNKKD